MTNNLRIEQTEGIYEPSIGETGNYIDNVDFYNYCNAVRCPCNNRLFVTKSSFKTHIGSKVHSNWLNNLNTKKSNFYVENIKLKEDLKNKKKILTEIDIENSQLKTKIKFLEEKVSNLQDLITEFHLKKRKNGENYDLLDFIN